MPAPRFLFLSVDGTKADWPRDGSSFTTAIQRLYDLYPLEAGPKDYLGGPGTDDRFFLWRWIETLLGTNERARLEVLREKLTTYRSKVAGVILAGWSRGGHTVISACAIARELGVPVRLLLLYDPVPARGLLAAARIVPFLPLPKTYKRPEGVERVVQILAGEEHSRLTRHAVLQWDPARDPEPHVLLADHRGTQNALGQAIGRRAMADAGVLW